MSKKGDMLGTIGKWVIGAVAVLIILTIFVRGFYKEIFDVGLKFAEKVKPVEKYQEGDSSGEEEELRRIQERFLQDISGKSGRECLVPYRLGELGDRMLEFSKSSSGTRVSGVLLGGKDRVKKINTQFFDGAICVINAPNFCKTYNLGGACKGDNPTKPLYKDITDAGLRITEEDIFVQTSFGEQKFLVNKGYIFKPEENKYCFIPQHSNLPGFGDCINTAHTIHVRCNTNLVSAVGLC